MAQATTATGNAIAKRKPVFIKVDQLKPGTQGHTLIVKVVSSKPVKVANNKPGRSSMLLSRPHQPARIAECLVGDETGTIVFTARNEQGR
jgi:replication factor A1